MRIQVQVQVAGCVQYITFQARDEFGMLPDPMPIHIKTESDRPVRVVVEPEEAPELRQFNEWAIPVGVWADEEAVAGLRKIVEELG